MAPAQKPSKQRKTMRTLGFALLIIGLIILAFSLYALFSDGDNTGENAAHDESANSSRSESQTDTDSSNSDDTTTQEIPRLELITLGVSAPIEHVGVNEDGNMQEPSNTEIVAWYSGGSYPGEGTNAVLAGHVDNRNNPEGGIFGQLETLTEGDEISYITDDGLLTYHVTTMNVYPYDDAPLDEIYSQSGPERLTLITCSGTWYPELEQYGDRLVVVAERI